MLNRWKWAWNRRRIFKAILNPAIAGAVLGALRVLYPSLIGSGATDWKAVAIQGVLFAIIVGFALPLCETVYRWFTYPRVLAEEENQTLRSENEMCRAALQRELATHPIIVFDSVQHSHIGLRPPGVLGGLLPSADKDGYSIEAWEVWFVNRPERNRPEATAKHLSARVDFCDDKWEAVGRSFIGQWAVTKMPDHVAWNLALQSDVDLPPGYSRAKLLVIGETSERLETRGPTGAVLGIAGVYGLSGENLHQCPDFANHHDYLLPHIATRLRVRLAAENMNECEFLFQLMRRQSDGQMESIKLSC